MQPSDFLPLVNQKLEVTTKNRGTLRGVLLGVSHDILDMRNDKGERLSVPLAKIDAATTVLV